MTAVPRAISRRPWSPWRVVVTFGLVSLCADMAYEGMRSVSGPLLAALGASALVVGVITGAGEAMALVLRLYSGAWADQSRRYWTLTVVGYALTAVCVPLLAVTPALGGAGLAVATVLILAERTGKAVRSPAKSALLAGVARQVGRGRGFAVHKALDQVGAFAGPLVVAAATALTAAVWTGLAVLAVPGVLCLVLLAVLRHRLSGDVAGEGTGSAGGGVVGSGVGDASGAAGDGAAGSGVGEVSGSTAPAGPAGAGPAGGRPAGAGPVGAGPAGGSATGGAPARPGGGGGDPEEGTIPPAVDGAPTRPRLPGRFWLFAVAVALSTGGAMTYGVFSFHLVTTGLAPVGVVPVVYAAAMASAAVAALVTGWVYDRVGAAVLLALPVLVAVVPPLALGGSLVLVVLGLLVWGAATGVQDSTVKALVADLAPQRRLGTAYGVFAAVQGVAALIGGALGGALYEDHRGLLAVGVALAQALALVVLVVVLRRR